MGEEWSENKMMEKERGEEERALSKGLSRAHQMMRHAVMSCPADPSPRSGSRSSLTLMTHPGLKSRPPDRTCLVGFLRANSMTSGEARKSYDASTPREAKRTS